MDFAYDPFDPAGDGKPVAVLPQFCAIDIRPYYMPQWDTFALSRFDDIWEVLEVNDGTFVASEGTLPPASVLAQHNDGPVDDPPLHPLPFHAVFDTPICTTRSVAHTRQPLRPRSVAGLEARIRALANERLDVLLPRGSFDLTQEYGGIVAASVVCELLGMPVDLAPQVLAAVNAGSLAEPGSGVDTAQARPNYLEYLIPVGRAPPGRSVRGALPVVDGLLGYRLPDGSALDDVEVATQMLCIFIGGTETVPKIVAHGLWELQSAARPVGRGARRPGNQRAVAREEMIRYCAPAQWFARTVRKPFTIHGTTIEPGQRVITLLASANRDEREYPEPDEFIWNRPISRIAGFRPRPALLHRLPPGPPGNCCAADRMAAAGAGLPRSTSEAATRLPSSFQWGWNKIPVEV